MIQTKNNASARKGKATEQLIAASCILASGGQLNASTGLVDDEGIDITFKRRNSSQTIDIQVKARFSDEEGSKLLRENQRLRCDVTPNTFQVRDNIYMLFVAVDGPEAEWGPAWLVPSAAFKKEAMVVGKQRKLRFDASVKKGSADKWNSYRLERADLAAELLKLLADK